MTDRFRTEVVARAYEADSNGHVAGVVLLQYAQHARWECLRAAGFGADDSARSGVAPVSLEERIRFRRELLVGEAVEVSCDFTWSEGKTFLIEQELRQPGRGLIAEVENVGGLMDLAERHLLANPADHMAAVASSPELVGL